MESKITTPNDLRRALMETIAGVIDGKLPVAHANAVVGLCQEVHKSIQQEWDMRVYATENLALDTHSVVQLIGNESAD